MEAFGAEPLEQVDLRIAPRPGELTGEFWVGDFRRR
jgi:hypothetical protein